MKKYFDADNKFSVKLQNMYITHYTVSGNKTSIFKNVLITRMNESLIIHNVKIKILLSINI